MSISDIQQPPELKPPFKDEFPDDGIQLGDEGERDYELGVHTISELVGSGIKRARTDEIQTPETQIPLTIPGLPPSRSRAAKTYSRRRTIGPDDNYAGYHGPVPENER